jgi:hypothetical protein
VSQPRISVYAGSADGNAAPTRIIQGEKTRQARTSHYIAIDSVRDELIVPNPFAQAILFFRGGANGNESPLRIIQGPKTLLSAVDNVAVDAVHREIYTASFPTDSIMVYRSDVGGDVEPIRILHGPHTNLDRPIRVEVDPVNNVLAVVNDHAIVVFNRTDNGDVAPKWVLGGTKVVVGASNGSRDVKLFPAGKKIIAGGAIRAQGQARPAERGGDGGEGRFGGQRFIGVWKYGDTGDAAPWAALNATQVTKINGSRLAINPEGGELLVGGDGVVHIYHLPEIFQRTD